MSGRRWSPSIAPSVRIDFQAVQVLFRGLVCERAVLKQEMILCCLTLQKIKNVNVVFEKYMQSHSVEAGSWLACRVDRLSKSADVGFQVECPLKAGL